MRFDFMNLFVFAHQDDEFGVFWEIKQLIASGKSVVVVYLTSGTLDGSLSLVRNQESVNVLSMLGVDQRNILFLGGEHCIPDGDLCSHLERAYEKLISALNNFSPPSKIYALAWEGGHQDHDAAHAIALALAKNNNILHNTYQFPLYTGQNTKWMFFKLFCDNKLNGLAVKSKIPFKDRMVFLTYIFLYPSQIKTWLFLYPFLLAHYFFSGKQILHPVSLGRLAQKPHFGTVLYERRKVYSYEKVAGYIERFAAKYLDD
jgi:LmbE family N-acetylglucosaminyl deacetylase